MFSPLKWGSVFGNCYCVKCEAPYRYETSENGIEKPVSRIKSGWLKATILYWNIYQSSVSDANIHDIEACKYEIDERIAEENNEA
jgi:hypothetical protein